MTRIIWPPRANHWQHSTAGQAMQQGKGPLHQALSPAMTENQGHNVHVFMWNSKLPRSQEMFLKQPENDQLGQPNKRPVINCVAFQAKNTQNICLIYRKIELISNNTLKASLIISDGNINFKSVYFYHIFRSKPPSLCKLSYRFQIPEHVCHTNMHTPLLQLHLSLNWPFHQHFIEGNLGNFFESAQGRVPTVSNSAGYVVAKKPSFTTHQGFASTRGTVYSQNHFFLF